MKRFSLLFALLSLSHVVLGQSLVYTPEDLGVTIESSSTQGRFWEPEGSLSEEVKDLSRYRLHEVWRTSSMLVAVGDQGAVLRSKDGVRWVRERTNTWEDLRSIWGQGDALFVVGANGTILSSIDGGKSWRQDVSPAEASLTSIWGRSAQELYIASDSGVVLRSTDKGKTWQESSQTTALSSNQKLRAVWGSSAKNVFAVGEGGLILHSIDGGERWEKAQSNTKQRLNAIWGSSAQEIYVAGDAGLLLRSTDGGVTWEEESSHTTANLLSIWGAGGDVFVLGEDVLLRRVNGAWVRVELPELKVEVPASTRRALFRWAFHRGDAEYQMAPVLFRGIWGSSVNNLFIVGKQGAIFNSKDAGKSWTQQESGTESTIRQIWGSSPTELFAVGKRVRLRSIDGGAHWSAEEIDDSLHVVWGRSSAAVFSAGNAGELARFSNASNTWNGAYETGKLLSIWGDDKVIFAVGNGILLRSTDGGDTWRSCPTQGSLSKIRGNKTTLFALGQNGTLWRSADGASWDGLTIPGSSSLNDLWVEGDELFLLAGDSSLLYSADGGSTWTKRETPEYPASLWGRTSSELYVLHDLILSRSLDHGKTWSEVYRNEDVLYEKIWGTEKSLYLFGFGSFLSSVDGISWKGQTPAEPIGSSDTKDALPDVYPSAAWYAPSKEIFLASSDGQILVSKDGGKKFQRLFGLDAFPLKIWGTSSKNLYVVTDSILYHSTNGGTVWRTEVLPEGASLSSIGGDEKQVFVVGLDGLLLRSTDGKNWKQLSLGTEDHLSSVLRVKSGFFLLGDGIIFHSKDGQKWSEVYRGEASLSAIHGNDSLFYAVGSESMLRSSDGGLSWEEVALPDEERGYLSSVWVAPSGTVCVADASRLLCSKDGDAWQEGKRQREDPIISFWGIGEQFFVLSLTQDATDAGVEGD